MNRAGDHIVAVELLTNDRHKFLKSTLRVSMVNYRPVAMNPYNKTDNCVSPLVRNSSTPLVEGGCCGPTIMGNVGRCDSVLE